MLLAVALCAAVYCVARLVFDDTVAIALTAVVFSTIVGLWIVLPSSMNHSGFDEPDPPDARRDPAPPVQRAPE